MQVFALLFCTLCAGPIVGQFPSERSGQAGLIAFRQALLDASSDRRVLILATHPDDPYRGMAVWLRQKLGWKVRVVVATRGEGGQNAVGPVGDVLRTVRTRETTQAARFMDVGLRFLDLPDFGYCRTAAEAMDRWSSLAPRERIKEAIQDFDPDLVYSPHGPAEAHGQKRAFYLLVKEALAGKGAPPFLRKASTDRDPDVQMRLDGLDLLRGKSYRETAWQALLFHRSQQPHDPLGQSSPRALRLDFERLSKTDTASWKKALEGAPEGLGDRSALADALGRAQEGSVGEPAWTLERLGAWFAGLRADRSRAAILDKVRKGMPFLKALAKALPAGSGEKRRMQARLLDLDHAILFGTGQRISSPRSEESVRELELVPEPYNSFLVPASRGEFRFSLRVRSSGKREIQARLAMTGPMGVRFLPESDRDRLPIRIRLQKGQRETLLSLRVRFPNRDRDVQYRPFWMRFYLAPPKPGATADKVLAGASCRVQVLPARVRLPLGLRVGLIRGPDPTIERSLDALLGDVDGLDPTKLARRNLDRYDSLLVDIRALQRRPDLRAQIPRLLAFARRGGHLVVLYHKAVEFNRDSTGGLLAPYPLELGKERVTREDAGVKMLLPRHPLMTQPNRILPSDWDDWVQERGLYFPLMGAYDARYEELLEIQELPIPELAGLTPVRAKQTFKPQRGSLLFARYGEGSYVYCALVLHRQLQKHHAGSARLLINLITPPHWYRFH